MNKHEYLDGNTIYYIFDGSPYFGLDNFWPDGECEYEGMTFKNSEAAFQAAKNKDLAKRIPFTTMDAGTSKMIGKDPSVTVLREDWEEVKDQVMYDVVLSKMLKNEYCRNLLISTAGMNIEEGNFWHDYYWGVDYKTRVGRNQLGKTLMKLRDEFINGKHLGKY